MEWIFDPTVWVGLSTLVVLEVVLGIDNVVFITILSEKLPVGKRDRARIIGLGFALIMRIILLCFAGWLMTLKNPIFAIADHSFNAKDLIMLAGGIFLLFKATMELNERLEGKDEVETKQKKTSSFWVVIAQIVVLDAVFSLDSVITAAGIAKDNIAVMIIAVTIAIILMMFASKPLAKFVNAHPTIVILCLSFLLMIGFSLIAEGFGVDIPKGYLYFAIGFSILIEFFNQMASFNRKKFLNKKPLRQRTAEAILGLLKSKEDEDVSVQSADETSTAHTKDQKGFNDQELSMVTRVLELAQRSVSSIMTSRHDVKMVNIDEDKESISKALYENQHTRLVVTDKHSLDEPIGIIEVNDLLRQMLQAPEPNYQELIVQPLIFPETISILVVLEQFKVAKTHFAFVVDEFGSMQGLISVTDVMENIAGEIPTENEGIDVRHDIKAVSENSWIANGYLPLEELVRVIHISLDPKREYHTLAGLLMEEMQHIPHEGEFLKIGGYRFDILKLESHRIIKVQITKLTDSI